MSTSVEETMNNIKVHFAYPTHEPSLKAAEALSSARMLFSLTTPLIAYQLFNCQILWTEYIPTGAATFINGKPVVYLNEKFFLNVCQNNKQRAFLLFHENLHIFAHHIGRQTDMGYNPKLWNIATDFYINYVAIGYYKNDSGHVMQADKYKDTFEIIPGALFDEKYVGMGSDEIYRSLIEEHGSAEKALKSFGYKEDEEGNFVFDPNGESQPLDEVETESMGSATKNKVNQISAGAIAQAKQSKKVGENEANIVQSLEDLFKPKINWKDQFSDEIKASSKERPTYNRLSRRSTGDILFPGMTGNRINVVMGIDTSGSMSHNDLTEGLTELSGILDQYEGWKVTLVSCDTTAHVIGEYESDFGDDFTNIDKNMIGGGGTEMTPIAEYANEVSESEEVNACVIFTDGHLSDGDIEPAITENIQYIVVVATGGNRNLQVNGAKVLFMDDIGV